MTYLKPKPEKAQATLARWKAKAPAGSDPADIDAIGTAYAAGAIREAYGDHLVAQAGTTELPDAIEALKHGGAVQAGSASARPPGAAASDGLAFADSYFAAKRGTAVKATTSEPTTAPAATSPRSGPPDTTVTAEQVDTYFSARRAARERTGRRH